MNALALIIALALSTPWIPPIMRDGDTLYGTSGYSALAGEFHLSQLTGDGGPVDVWLYDHQRLTQQFHWDLPAPPAGITAINLIFDSRLFDQALFRGQDAIARWDGQVFTFKNIVETPEPSTMSLCVIGAVASILVWRATR